MAKNTKKITEKHTAPDNFSKRIENIPAGVVSKIAKIDELKGQWISGARLSPQVLGRLLPLNNIIMIKCCNRLCLKSLIISLSLTCTSVKTKKII